MKPRRFCPGADQAAQLVVRQCPEQHDGRGRALQQLLFSAAVTRQCLRIIARVAIRAKGLFSLFLKVPKAGHAPFGFAARQAR